MVFGINLEGVAKLFSTTVTHDSVGGIRVGKAIAGVVGDMSDESVTGKLEKKPIKAGAKVEVVSRKALSKDRQRYVDESFAMEREYELIMQKRDEEAIARYE